MISSMYPSYLVDNMFREVHIKRDTELNPQEKQLEGMSDGEKKEVEELKKRDREVRQHEQAHKSAGGHYIRGGASYTFKKGPDGQLYAVGGEVSIDVSDEQNPEATKRKMETVRSAAMAPAKPSGQDRAVAAKAARKIQQADREISEKRREDAKPDQTQSENKSVPEVFRAYAPEKYGSIDSFI